MDIGEYFRFLLALIFVLALIVVLAKTARRAGFGFPVAATRRNSDKRLSVVEVIPIDGRRRLILIRRDNVEHLVMLGPTTETVIETGITSKNGKTAFQNALEHVSEGPNTERDGSLESRGENAETPKA